MQPTLQLGEDANGYSRITARSNAVPVAQPQQQYEYNTLQRNAKLNLGSPSNSLPIVPYENASESKDDSVYVNLGSNAANSTEGAFPNEYEEEQLSDEEVEDQQDFYFTTGHAEGSSSIPVIQQDDYIAVLANKAKVLSLDSSTEEWARNGSSLITISLFNSLFL